MCRLPLNCSFLKIHPWWLVWHSFLKPLLFLDLHREINLQWQTDMLNTNLKFNWNYFMALWSIVTHYLVLPWLQNGKRSRNFFFFFKALKLLLPCLQHREEGGWVFPFSVWATWEDKLGEATGKSHHYFLPFNHACSSLPGAHTAPSQDRLWVRASQRESCCDWQQARVLFFGSSISFPGWGCEWRNKVTLHLLVGVQWGKEPPPPLKEATLRRWELHAFYLRQSIWQTNRNHK